MARRKRASMREAAGRPLLGSYLFGFVQEEQSRGTDCREHQHRGN